MPQITIAIPAFKTAHLAQAIASVLAQTFTDYELLISDDSPDGSVREVVARFTDPRVRLVQGPRRGLIPNSMHLWENAATDLLKFVYDDDFLLPFCLAELARPLQADPTVAFAFCFRHIVDDAGLVVASPEPFASKTPLRFEPHALPEHMLSRMRNPIGEPSNILIRRSLFADASCLGVFCGIPMRHMIDVTFYLNAAQRGPCVGVPGFHAAFRRHDTQVSRQQTAPAFSAGLYEWEVLLRGAVQLGLVAPATAVKGLPELERYYRLCEAPFPELTRRREGLPALKARLEAGETQVLDDEFRAEWRWADGLVRQRLGEGGGAPPPAAGEASS